MSHDSLRLPAEFEAQSFVQLIFPHAQSDWAPYLDEACRTFAKIAAEMAHFEPCLIVCDDIARVKSYLNDTTNIHFVTYLTDDTWARDCSGISVRTENGCFINDFTFTAWGGKFEAAKDNAMTASIASCYGNPVNAHDFILEGGAIESDGEGVVMTTAQCLMNSNRNPVYKTEASVNKVLHETLGTLKTLWLHHGYLAGDDTDSHIDTLARFCDRETICYIQCTNPEDEHYAALKAMEDELKTFTNREGKPYHLVPLPMTNPISYEGERLPATYANFLIINGAVLVPTYNDPNDEAALDIFKALFPDREVIGIDCSVLIRQHGSLHCVTMHFPECITLQRS